MTLLRPLQITFIAVASVLSLVACSDSDDDDNGVIAGNLPVVENTSPDDDAPPVEDDPIVDNAPAQVLLFDETTDGDIINDPNNPQFLQLIVGQNGLNASVVAPDLDYITINVPAGSQLTSIELVDYASMDDQSFIGIQAGSVFTVLADDPIVEDLLGFLLFGVNMIGTDILAGMGLGAGAQGFTPPLEAGDYAFWIQETGADPANFSLNFVVEPTP